MKITLYTPLDVGTLARYCDCELSYAEASAQKSFWLEVCRRRLEAIACLDALAEPKPNPPDLEEAYAKAEKEVDFWAGQMVKFEKMARSNATEMGMTVSSRCRLVVPKSDTKEDADPITELQKQLFGT